MVFCPNREILVALGEGIMEKLIGCLNFLCDLLSLCWLLRVGLRAHSYGFCRWEWKLNGFHLVVYASASLAMAVIYRRTNRTTLELANKKCQSCLDDNDGEDLRLEVSFLQDSRIYYSSCFITLRILPFREWWKIFLFTCLSRKTCLEK